MGLTSMKKIKPTLRFKIWSSETQPHSFLLGVCCQAKELVVGVSKAAEYLLPREPLGVSQSHHCRVHHSGRCTGHRLTQSSLTLTPHSCTHTLAYPLLSHSHTSPLPALTPTPHSPTVAHAIFLLNSTPCVTDTAVSSEH